MDEKPRKTDLSYLATGGGVLLGLGAGFIYLPKGGLVFVGCLMGGIGLGLIITAILSVCKKGS